MPITLYCPNNHQLVVEMEHVGKKVRCPACKVVMVVPDPRQGVAAAPQHYPQQPPSYPPQQPAPHAAPRQPVPPPMQQGVQPRGAPPMQRRPPEPIEELEELPEEEDRPRKKKKGQTRSRMRLANIGLAFHYAKLICMIVMIALSVLGNLILPIMAGAAQSMALLNIAAIASLISFILFAVTPLLGGVGSLLCFWVPEKSRAKVLVIVSFGLEVGSIVIVLIMFLVAMGAEPRPGGRGTQMEIVGMVLVMLLLAFLVFLASFILFMLFLRQMGRYIGDRMCADEAIRVMVVFLSVLLGGFLGIFILGIALRGAGMVGGVVVLGAVVLWQFGVIMTLFGILNLIGTLRAHINSRWG